MGNRHSYDDYPDGTHCVYKTLCVTKVTTILSIMLGGSDIIMHVRPSNIGGVLVHLPKYVVPGVFMGVAFGLTTCTMAQIRQKDDLVNYFCGGVTSGAVLGACRRSFGVGVPCAILLGLAAMLHKTVRQNGWEYFPQVVNTIGDFDSMLADYTITPDIPRYTLDRPSRVD